MDLYSSLEVADFLNLNIFADKKVDPLTDEQKAVIHRMAVDDIAVDCINSTQYSRSVVEAWVNGMTLQDKLDTISSDHECQRDMLGFDPKTGEPYIEDVEVDLRDTCIDFDKDDA